MKKRAESSRIDFSATNLDAPTFDVPTGPFGAPCPQASAAPTQWDDLRTLAQQYGFPAP